MLSEIRRMERIFSTFRSDSELTRWQVTLGVEIEVSEELAELLEAAAFWRIKTGGAFDSTCEEWTRPIPRFADQRVTGALDRLWEVARLRRVKPQPPASLHRPRSVWTPSPMDT